MSEPEIKTYRGGSLEELLPKIRDELGPDAVIMRQREGIVGGVGGFFGKKCVEVDVAPPARAVAAVPGPAVPRGSLIDTYDTGSPPGPESYDFDPHALDLDLDPDLDDHALDLATDDEPGAPAVHDGDLMETLIAQASPFADELAQVWETELFDGPAAREDEAPALRVALVAAGISQRTADAIVEEADRRLRPFAPDLPLAEHVRAALARRIAIDTGGRQPRRIALVGPPGAGRTLAAAKLCGAFARGGLSVCAVSLEPARSAFDLASVTEPFGVALETADDPETIELVRKRLRGYDVVVADTPALDLAEADSGARLARLLRALHPTETILVAPAGTPVDTTRLLVRELRAHTRLRSLLVTHADLGRPRGSAVGVAVAEKLPVSYVSDGPLAQTGIRTAAADELARMVVPSALTGRHADREELRR
jgi:flagellar biosynthesis GTPase FlhF